MPWGGRKNVDPVMSDGFSVILTEGSHGVAVGLYTIPSPSRWGQHRATLGQGLDANWDEDILAMLSSVHGLSDIHVSSRSV